VTAVLGRPDGEGEEFSRQRDKRRRSGYLGGGKVDSVGGAPVLHSEAQKKEKGTEIGERSRYRSLIERGGEEESCRSKAWTDLGHRGIGSSEAKGEGSYMGKSRR